jgi:hypothetical protein
MTHSLADDYRGHPFLPEREELDAMPRLYATESVKADDKIVVLHFFTGVCDWWIVEVGEDHRIAFGYACLGDEAGAEWGYVDLVELRTLFVQYPGMMPVYVERDLHWSPRPFRDI